MYSTMNKCTSLNSLMEENTFGYAFFKTSRKAKKTNHKWQNYTTYLHAQSSKSHLGHYCYCLLASSWLAMSQQAMDNWDHQHLEDLGG